MRIIKSWGKLLKYENLLNERIDFVGGNIMENKSYSYYISYVYSKEVFSFDFFGANSTSVFGAAHLNYNKPLEEFLMEDYEEIRKMIADSLNKDLNKNLKEEDRKDRYTKEHIIIINIISKKYEVINNGKKREN